MPVEINVLGPFEAWKHGNWIHIGGPTQRALAGALAVHRGAGAGIDHLSHSLWGETLPATYRQQVHKRVHELRRMIGEWSVRTVEGGYRLDCQTDIGRFDEALVQARVAAGEQRSSKAVGLYRAALALWRGPVLDGLRNEVPCPALDALEEERLRALEECVELELGLGLHVDLVDELRALVATNPFREQFVGQLMLALHRCGGNSAALEVYDRHRTLVIAESGHEPSTTLRELHGAVLRQASELDLPEPVPWAGRVPAGLPMDLQTFTGRTAELATMDELLPTSDTGVRLVSISGQAGVGKTALALRWAHRMRHRFPDGQLYVNLRGYDKGAPMSVDDALTGFLHALGVPGDRIPEQPGARGALYRSVAAGRRLLVVLDNAVDADQVRPLLPGTAGSLVLATSRTAPDLLTMADDARWITLDKLSTSDSVELVRRVLGDERVDAEPDAVAELTGQCGQLPLALRIVAANLAARPKQRIAEVVAGLRADPLDRLGVDGEPDTSVRTAFDWSYESVSDLARLLLRHLCLVPGDDIAVDAVAALMDLDDVHTPLLELEVACLAEQNQPGRFRLHDLVRHYADTLADHEDDAATVRLLGWYLAGIDAAIGLLDPALHRQPRPFSLPAQKFSDRESALDWLRAERPNLVAAVGWAAEHGHDELCAHLVDALRGFFWLDRTTPDWISTGEIGLAAVGRLDDQPLEAAVHRSLGLGYGAQDRFDESRHHFDHAVAMGDPVSAAYTRADIGTTFLHFAHTGEVTDHFTSALRFSRSAGEPELTTSCLVGLATTNVMQGRLSKALELIDEAVNGTHAPNSAYTTANAHGVRAAALIETGALEEAWTELELALRLHPESAGSVAEVTELVRIGRIHLLTSSVDEAVYAFDTAVGLAEERAYVDLLCLALTARASADLALHDTTNAAGRLDEVLRLAGPWRTVEALVELAAVHVARDESVAAQDSASHALWLGEQHGWHLHDSRAHHLLALAQGPAPTALTQANHALAVSRRAGQRLREAEDLLLIGELTNTDVLDEVNALVLGVAGALGPAVLRTLRS